MKQIRKQIVTAIMVTLAAFGLLFVSAIQPATSADKTSQASEQTARKAACTTAAWVSSGNEAHDAGGIGGIHIWHLEAMKSDCDGYDRVIQYRVIMTKQNGKCSNGTVLNKINNYDVNPNALDGYNPGTRTTTCTVGTTNYSWYFVPATPLTIHSTQPAAARCVGATVQVDKGPALSDFNGNIPALCFNGL